MTMRPLNRNIPVLSLLLALFLLMGPGSTVAQQQKVQKAPEATFTAEGKHYSISDFKGKKIMLWMFSTWCSSCSAGMEALAERQDVLKENGFTVIALRNHENGGYPGPAIEEFAQKYGENIVDAPNWLLGEASKELASRYNHRNYPDIYFLIDENGYIQGMNGAPGATIDQILEFAGAASR